MRVILEGPDNAGKTTLAKRLIEALGEQLTYFHPGGKPVDFDHETRCMSEQLHILQRFKRVIMDRITPISQRVYNPDEVLDRIRASTMDEFLREDVLIIYCRPSTDRLLRVQDLTWRDGETEEHRQKIINNQHIFVDRYDAIMTTVPCITYDFDHSSAEVIFTKLVKTMNGSLDDINWFKNLINWRS